MNLSKMEAPVSNKLDDEFIKLMVRWSQVEIESLYVDFTKHEKIRVEQWVKA
jgi:hypothetical protein